MIRSWLEISRDSIRTNVEAVGQRIPADCEILAVVKADAYGMGIEGFVDALSQAGVTRFAVATAEEGAAVRHSAPASEILVLGGFEAADEDLFVRHQLTAAVFDNRAVPAAVPVHLKVNSGMNRLGLTPAAARARAVEMGGQVRGVFSHFASAASDSDFTREQLRRFLEASEGLGLPRHISNSAGLQFSEAALDAVRVGLALHGIDQGCDLDLAPVMSWQTRLLTVLPVAAGESVGYGRAFSTQRSSRLGVLPVGYADGYPAAFAECGVVRAGQRTARVAGRVSMDLLTVDLTDFGAIEPGDRVTLIDNQVGAAASVAELCAATGLTAWEFLTGIGNRVERRFVD